MMFVQLNRLLLSLFLLCEHGDLTEEFLAEAPNQWKKYYALHNCARITEEYVSKLEKNGVVTSTIWENEALTNGNCFAWDTTKIVDGEFERKMATVFNRQYEFELGSQIVGGDWVAQALSIHKTTPPKYPQGRISNNSTGLRCAYATWPLDVPLDAFDLESENVEVLESRIDEVDGKSLARITLKFNFPDSIPEDGMISSQRGALYRVANFSTGTIWFDRDNFWLPVRAEFDCPHISPPLSIETTWEYRGSDFPLVFRRTEILRSDDFVITKENRNIEYYKKRPAKSRFYMAYYGLPEPNGINITPVWVWLVAAAFLMTTIGLSIRYAKNRMR